MVPNLVGLNINEARATLAQLGLVPVETYQDSAKPKDEILGHVVATLKAVGLQHAMVVDRDEAGRSIVRGLFAVSQLNRQLAETFDPTEIARSFADVEMALAYH